jgi:putative ABC transport system ATP-binding protein
MIEIKNIHLSFINKVIFNNYSMKIEKGEKVLIKASSGKGKSTLFKTLLGFQKIDKGDIFINGKKLGKSNMNYYRRNIGYVSQDVELANRNVWDYITQVFNYKYNRHINITKDQVIDIANYFMLQPDILDKEIIRLSGGERQRLGLIICILLDRNIWLLDEVTSGLDKETKKRVVEFVLNLDKTILIISHDNIWCENDIVRIEEW